MRLVMKGVALCFAALFGAAGLVPQQPYDLLLKGGHVIDARNGIDAVRDVAIADGNAVRRRPRERKLSLARRPTWRCSESSAATSASWTRPAPDSKAHS